MISILSLFLCYLSSGGVFAVRIKLFGFMVSVARKTTKKMKQIVLVFWWLLREICRLAKVDRGEEHSVLMYRALLTFYAI